MAVLTVLIVRRNIDGSVSGRRRVRAEDGRERLVCDHEVLEPLERREREACVWDHSNDCDRVAAVETQHAVTLLFGRIKVVIKAIDIRFWFNIICRKLTRLF